MHLLTSNAKLEKGSAGLGYLAMGVQLAPGNLSGRELCPHRGACFATCLFSAGHGKFASVHNARLERAKLWNEHPKAFLALLDMELGKLSERAERRHLQAAVRLNVFSDIAWEAVAPDLFTSHPSIQFYDYTKWTYRAQRSRPQAGAIGWPANYDLTYSWSESSTYQWGRAHLTRGGKIAYVSREFHESGSDAKDVPKWMIRHGGWQDGDEHDLTFLHPHGSILYLRPKGELKTKRTPFRP